MRKQADLPHVLPIFPLPGALLLPRARLPLHMFEPRYLAMLEDVLKTDHRMIGMIQPRDLPAGCSGSKYHKIGCAGRVTAFSETEDGRYMITLTGISRYKVRREIESFSPYVKAEVDWASFPHDEGGAETDPDFDRQSFLDSLDRYFRDLGLSSDWDSLCDAEDELLINSLSMLCPFEPEDKQALLEAPCLGSRRETLVTLIEYALRGGSSDKALQ